MLIDTHAHLMFPEFKDDLSGVFERAAKAGLKAIINVGCTVEASKQAFEMLKKWDGEAGVSLYATLGLHPYDVEDLSDELLQDWEGMINKKIVAIGEIGLDYFKAKTPKDVQQNAFRKQLEFAKKMNLPVVVHNREADEDSLEILKEVGFGKAVVTGLTESDAPNVVFHCYGSNLEFARRLWVEGFMTSFTGIVTYPNAKELHEVVRECPLDKFMIETDCPYLAPQTYRGKRNEPSYVAEVAKEIARLKGLSFDEIDRLQEENARRFYGV